MQRRLAWIALLTLLLLPSCGRPPAPLAQDAYVWQRLWTPALLSALTHATGLIGEWRVLAAETDASGTLRPVKVDWAALRATGRPVIAVVRLDASLLRRWREASLLAQIQARAAGWRGLAGLEIDYDCGTARLSDYAQFLGKLRAMRGLPRPLSITALPAWLASPALAPVLANIDEAVLQVHAVQAPQEGLFEPDRARRWIDAFDARTSRPFRVALPDYGARAAWDDDGRLLAIESETPKLEGGAQTSELMAFPDQVARLFRSLKEKRPHHLDGIVWFRLPTDADALTWSFDTWRAVVRGETLSTDLFVRARAGTVPGMRNIVLENGGDIDAALPRRVTLPPGCRIADGINGYALVAREANMFLERHQSALLRAHSARSIGWMRCAPGALDVQP